MPSAGQREKERRMAQLRMIYEESHEIYGVPQIAARMRRKGDRISERTVGKYMIISWTLGKTLEVKWVLEAVGKAKEQRCVTEPLIIYSDRGIQYTCKGYEEATRGISRSYSAKACPWDNACIESFHTLIKREWLSRFRIKDYSHAGRFVFEYIEAFYNTVRLHSHCGYRSPAEYEEQHLERMEAKVKSEEIERR